MTQFSKIFIIFSTVVSLVFLGVVSVNRAGGINWEVEAEGESKDDPISKFQFDRTEGEVPVYSATDRISDDKVGTSSAVLAEKVIDVRKQILATQTQTLEKQNQDISKVKVEIVKAKELIVLDVVAIEKRIENLDAQRKEIEKKFLAAQDTSADKSREALKRQTEANQRRLDIYRLSNELAELRADKYRISEQLIKMNDSLIRLQGINIRLKDRNQQLKK